MNGGVGLLYPILPLFGFLPPQIAPLQADVGWGSPTDFVGWDPTIRKLHRSQRLQVLVGDAHPPFGDLLGTYIEKRRVMATTWKAPVKVATTENLGSPPKMPIDGKIDGVTSRDTAYAYLRLPYLRQRHRHRH
jgi:hypothetical protein